MVFKMNFEKEKKDFLIKKTRAGRATLMVR